MQRQIMRAYRLIYLSLFSVILAGSPLVARADSGPVFSGRATAVSGQILGIPLDVSDTGMQNSPGFAEQASGPSLTVANPTGGPALLSAETLHATTIGQGDRARSEASLAQVSLNVAGNTVSASFLTARAMAVCGASGPSASGSSELANLVINNQTIAVGTSPNQVITAGPVTAYINQQNGSSNSIDVTALRVLVTDPLGGQAPADVSFSSVHADVTCGGPANCASGKDFVTGGGWIIPPLGSDKANFAVAGGLKNGAFWGHLEYIDHNNGVKIHGTGVTAYTIDPAKPNSRHIEGTADMNGQPVTYKVDVSDNGEPGRGVDQFAIQVSSGYSASPAFLGGGNIQLHQPCQ